MRLWWYSSPCHVKWMGVIGTTREEKHHRYLQHSLETMVVVLPMLCEVDGCDWDY
jgi:hypothetical protein